MASFRNKRDTLANWTLNNPVLGPGVIAITEETEQFKIGNGVSHWDGLPSFLPGDDVEVMIYAILDSLPTGEVTQQDLDDHINSPAPHPAYDNGFDLAVFYENVKAG